MKKFFERWKPAASKFSLEHLQQLFDRLVQHERNVGANADQLVETLREIAELLIWGDQHNPEFFDYFLEKQILQHFIRVLFQVRHHAVQVQIIQTLSMLVANVGNELSLYYILSGNHINNLLRHRFDFSDEEVLSHYISFCKTIAVRLTPSTVQFFFDKHREEFPLYTETVRFCQHDEILIRTHVRTIALNVFKVADRGMEGFVRQNAGRLLGALCWSLREAYTRLDALMVALNSHLQCVGSPTRERPGLELPDLYTVTMLQQDQIDTLLYLNDLCALQSRQVSSILTDNFLHIFLLPFVAPSFLGSGAEEVRPVSRPIATFLLAQLFLVLTSPDALGDLLSLLLRPADALLPVRLAPDAVSTIMPYLNAPPSVVDAEATAAPSVSPRVAATAPAGPAPKPAAPPNPPIAAALQRLKAAAPWPAGPPSGAIPQHTPGAPMPPASAPAIQLLVELAGTTNVPPVGLPLLLSVASGGRGAGPQPGNLTSLRDALLHLLPGAHTAHPAPRGAAAPCPALHCCVECLAQQGRPAPGLALLCSLPPAEAPSPRVAGFSTVRERLDWLRGRAAGASDAPRPCPAVALLRQAGADRDVPLPCVELLLLAAAGKVDSGGGMAAPLGRISALVGGVRRLLPSPNLHGHTAPTVPVEPASAALPAPAPNPPPPVAETEEPAMPAPAAETDHVSRDVSDQPTAEEHNPLLARLAAPSLGLRCISAALIYALVTNKAVPWTALKELQVIPEPLQLRHILMNQLTETCDGIQPADGPPYPAAVLEQLLDIVAGCVEDVGHCRLNSLLVVVHLILELLSLPAFPRLLSRHQQQLQRVYATAVGAAQRRLDAYRRLRPTPSVGSAVGETRALAIQMSSTPPRRQPPLHVSPTPSPPPSVPSSPPRAQSPLVRSPLSPSDVQGSVMERSLEELLIGFTDELRPKFSQLLRQKPSDLISDVTALITTGWGEPLAETLPAWVAALDVEKRCPATPLEQLEQQLQVLQAVEFLAMRLTGREESLFAPLASPKPPPAAAVDMKDRAGVQPCRVLARAPDARPFTDQTGHLVSAGTQSYAYVDGEYLVLVEPSPTVLHRATVRHAAHLFYCEIQADALDSCRVWVVVNDCRWRPRQVLCLLYESAAHAAHQKTLLAEVWAAVWQTKMSAAAAVFDPQLPVPPSSDRP